MSGCRFIHFKSPLYKLRDDNPYESPNTVSESTVAPNENTSARFGWFLAVAVAASLGSFVVPFLIPLSFLLVPAVARAWSIRRQRMPYWKSQANLDFLQQVGVSIVYALPAFLAAHIAFGCVCLPGAALGMTVMDAFYNNPQYGLMLIGGGLLLVVSTFTGLWFGDGVMRRFRFYSDRASATSATAIAKPIEKEEQD